MGTKPTKKRQTVSESKPNGTPKASVSKKNQKPLSQRGEFESIRLDLERQRAEILGEAAAFSNKPEQGGYPDVTDQASAEVDKSFDIRLREREQKLLKKIDEALERMASDTYGICEECGEVIPVERLKARPVTTLCIRCKTQQEEKEKARG